jgi:hypothetical protein
MEAQTLERIKQGIPIEPKTEWVYFTLHPAEGLVKIGKSRKASGVRSRVRSNIHSMTENWDVSGSYLLHKLPTLNCEQLEKSIHSLFEQQRITNWHPDNWDNVDGYTEMFYLIIPGSSSDGDFRNNALALDFIQLLEELTGKEVYTQVARHFTGRKQTNFQLMKEKSVTYNIAKRQAAPIKKTPKHVSPPGGADLLPWVMLMMIGICAIVPFAVQNNPNLYPSPAVQQTK